MNISRRHGLKAISSLGLNALISAGGAGLALAAPARPGASTGNLASVEIDPHVVGSKVSSEFAGLSYEKSQLKIGFFSPSNTALIDLYKLLGPGVVRLGGILVDWGVWPGGPRNPFTRYDLTTAEVDDLAAFLKLTGWRVIYGINLANNSLTSAVAEASYVARILGGSLLAFSLGNEPSSYVGLGYRPATYGYADFLKEWRTMAQAIRAAVPGAVFSGAADWNFWNSTIPFAKDARDLNSLLTYHFYVGDALAPTSTLDRLLRPNPMMTTQFGFLNVAARQNKLSLGWRLDEANTYYHGGADGVSNSFGSALWVIDFLFQVALSGGGGVNFHGGQNGPYTPIVDANGKVVELRPEFYGMMMFALGAQGKAFGTKLTLTPTTNVTAYGVIRADGGLNVMLLNKEPVSAVQAQVTGLSLQLNAFAPVWLKGQGLTRTSGQTLNDAPITANGSWTPAPAPPVPITGGVASLTLPPASAVLLRSPHQRPNVEGVRR